MVKENMNRNKFSAEFLYQLNLIKDIIEQVKCYDPYDRKRVIDVSFKYPYIQGDSSHVIALALMRLLIKHVYSMEFEYAKFTVGYAMKIHSGKVHFTIGDAITINADPDINVYLHLKRLVMRIAELYPDGLITGVVIRVFIRGMKEKDVTLTCDEIDSILWEVLNSELNSDSEGDLPEVVSMARKPGYPDHITAIPLPRSLKREPFIVADTETVMINDIQVPYAAGFMVVKPGQDVVDSPIDTYFSEDDYFRPEFQDRSNSMMFDFLEHLAVVADKTKIRTVYFHNFSRFDGILLLKYYANKGDKYTIKPLMRNLRLYELKVYRTVKKRVKLKVQVKVKGVESDSWQVKIVETDTDKKILVLKLRDSLNLLPSSLEKLAKALCPELGVKGSIAHDDITVDTLLPLRKELLTYMEQDIRLLGGIMRKAQDIYYNEFKVDMVNSLTYSALSMTIYRQMFYDALNWPIHIPTRNEDTFIRRGYYGGHVDVYIPYGTDLYYYDVNSLYPFIMKSFPMPGGKPVWHGNLKDMDLSYMTGFIEAYVVCPNTLKRPFLPYKDSNDRLLFPTGEFVGVYYSEELKFARNLGYIILPLRGYLFDKKPSPFSGFVSTLYNLRKEAKKAGDESMVYVYKTLMNSLYGRFGINPKSTVTEVCDSDRYDELTMRDNFINGDKLSEKYYVVSYYTNTLECSDSEWNAPKHSAVQLAAAITACARIHMYKYISRPDCYYTDTDSVVLGSPLPEEEISSTELGKLKLEYELNTGIFLGGKSYALETKQSGDIVKHKGLAKQSVSLKWFQEQYADLFRTQQVTVVSNFRIDWKTFDIAKKSMQVKLGIPVGTKRDPVYDDNNVWVDTIPKEVFDFGGDELSILKHENKILKAQLDEQEKEYAHRLLNLEVENERNKKEYAHRLLNLEVENERNKTQYDQRLAMLESSYDQRLAMLESKLAKLTANLDKKDNESASSADHMKRKMEEYNYMTNKAMESDKQISDLKEQLDMKDRESAARADYITEEFMKSDKLISELKMQLDMKDKESANRADHIQIEFMKSDKQIEYLQELLDRKDQEYASLHAQYVNKYNENALLRVQFDKKDKKSANIVELTVEDYKDKVNTYNYMVDQYHKKSAQIVSLQEQLDNYKHESAFIVSIPSKEYYYLSNKAMESDEQIEDLKKQLINKDRENEILRAQAAKPSSNQIIDYSKNFDIQDLQRLRESAAKFKEEEALLRKELQSKSAKLPQVPVRGPRTEPPTRFNHPTEGNEGNEGKSDKKLRWEQQRRDKPP